MTTRRVLVDRRGARVYRSGLVYRAAFGDPYGEPVGLQGWARPLAWLARWAGSLTGLLAAGALGGRRAMPRMVRASFVLGTVLAGVVLVVAVVYALAGGGTR